VTEYEYKVEEGLVSSQSAAAVIVCGTPQLHAVMLITKDILNTKMTLPLTKQITI
jgi:hypothetical protein